MLIFRTIKDFCTVPTFAPYSGKCACRKALMVSILQLCVPFSTKLLCLSCLSLHWARYEAKVRKGAFAGAFEQGFTRSLALPPELRIKITMKSKLVWWLLADHDVGQPHRFTLVPAKNWPYKRDVLTSMHFTVINPHLGIFGPSIFCSYNQNCSYKHGPYMRAPVYYFTTEHSVCSRLLDSGDQFQYGAQNLYGNP